MNFKTAPQQAWRWLHSRPRSIRIPLKLLVLFSVILLVCYPYPGFLLAHLRHLRDPAALVDPDAPELAPLAAELEPQFLAIEDAQARLDLVQAYVCYRIPYAFDWETWGVLDYIPTVPEILAQGREDCDGRAVLAASLLRRFGLDARLVADGAHVWVWTPEGQTMQPNAVPTLTATDEGVRIDWSGLAVLPRAAAFGLAVFPLARELIVLAVLWLVLLGPGTGRTRGSLGLVGLLLALACFKLGGGDWYRQNAMLLIAGLILLCAAIILMLLPRRRSATA